VSRPDRRQPAQPAQGGDRWLVLINKFVPRSGEHEVNATLSRAASRYPPTCWHNSIDHHRGLLWSDNIHPRPVGGKLYAKLVREAVLGRSADSPG
jgi:hypothetical protein